MISAGSGKIEPMASSRLRSVGSVSPAAVAPLSEEEELLRKLRDGEIDPGSYYDSVVELSLAHLRGQLTAEKLEIVRERMREEIETNPVLVKMVRDAMRGLPSSSAG